MNILTYVEAKAIRNKFGVDQLELIRETEAAVLSKLSKGWVMPEPVSGRCKDCNAVGASHCSDPINCGGMDWHYSEVQIREAYAAGAASQLSSEPVAWECSDNELIRRGYQRFAATPGGDWNIPVFTKVQP